MNCWKERYNRLERIKEKNNIVWLNQELDIQKQYMENIIETIDKMIKTLQEFKDNTEKLVKRM